MNRGLLVTLIAVSILYAFLHWKDVETMHASGLSPFAYQSLMIYPTDAFSKNGRPTLVSTRPNEVIDSIETLSEFDRYRLVRAFGVIR